MLLRKQIADGSKSQVGKHPEVELTSNDKRVIGLRSELICGSNLEEPAT
jgi:hypothetical protein